MKRVYLSFTVLLLCFMVSFTAHAAEKPAKPANNNQIITLQNAKADPLQAGSVTLEYYGHAAMRVTSPKGVDILLDPWKNDPSGTWGIWFPKEFPLTSADIAMSTHAHYDHNALHRVKSHMVLDRMAGVWSFSDVRITGIADKHQYKSPGPVRWTDLFQERGIDPVPPNNPPVLDNNIYVIETGGLRICHWGDNRPDAPEAVFAAIGQPDVLILPIEDSLHILDYTQVAAVIAKLKPRVIIPAHYLMTGVSSVASTLEKPEAWLKTQKSVTRHTSPVYTLDPAAVKKMNGHVLYFGDNAVKP